MGAAPTKLVEVRNLHSHALTPSEVSLDGLEELVLAHGNHIYLVLLGPRVRVRGVDDRDSAWRVLTEFDSEGATKPRTLLIPKALLGGGELRLSGMHVVHRSTSSAETKYTATHLARALLDGQMQGEVSLDPAWVQHTIAKFFTYTVVYVGQALGRKKGRSPIARFRAGHEHLQMILAEVHDFNPDREVAVGMADHSVSRVEIHGFSGPDTWELMAAMSQTMFEDFGGPLEEDKSAVDAIEGLLIRYFQPEENTRLKGFPTRDLPSLIRKLQDAYFTHLAIDFDVSGSHALLRDPKRNRVARVHRFSVNISTGEPEVASTTPFSWSV